MRYVVSQIPLMRLNVLFVDKMETLYLICLGVTSCRVSNLVGWLHSGNKKKKLSTSYGKAENIGWYE